MDPTPKRQNNTTDGEANMSEANKNLETEHKPSPTTANEEGESDQQSPPAVSSKDEVNSTVTLPQDKPPSDESKVHKVFLPCTDDKDMYMRRYGNDAVTMQYTSAASLMKRKETDGVLQEDIVPGTVLHIERKPKIQEKTQSSDEESKVQHLIDSCAPEETIIFKDDEVTDNADKGKPATSNWVKLCRGPRTKLHWEHAWSDDPKKNTQQVKDWTDKEGFDIIRSTDGGCKDNVISWGGYSREDKQIASVWSEARYGKKSTQAELNGFRDAMKYTQRGKKNLILTDNQGLVVKLSKKEAPEDLKKQIEDLGGDLTVAFVPGHRGIIPNETADNLARMGRDKFKDFH